MCFIDPRHAQGEMSDSPVSDSESKHILQMASLSRKGDAEAAILPNDLKDDKKPILADEVVLLASWLIFLFNSDRKTPPVYSNSKMSLRVEGRPVRLSGPEWRRALHKPI